MENQEYNLKNVILFIILIIIIINSTIFSCCTIHFNNLLKIFNCKSCKLIYDFGISKDNWNKASNI